MFGGMEEKKREFQGVDKKRLLPLVSRARP